MSRYEVELPATPPARLDALVVRAPTGAEELRALRTPGTQRALTGLIASCVQAVAARQPLGADAARALSSGERTRVAFAMAVASDGGVVRRGLRCPAPSCRATAPVDVALDSLPERPPPPATGTIRCPIPADRALPVRGYATFRLPDGADQEAVEATSSDWRDSGLSGGPVLVRLLDRLLIAVQGELSGESALWSEEDRQSAWNAIRGALGGPDAELDVSCPVCGTHFVHRIGPLGWLRTDPRAAERQLLDEVVRLAAAYGWTEEQTLWLPRPRRRALAATLRPVR